MTQGGDDPQLGELAEESAASLENTLQSVLSNVPSVTAFFRTDDAIRKRVHVAPRATPELPEVATVPLMINGRHRLNLRVELWCTWDHTQRFLTIEKSTFAVETLGAGTRAQPLFRYEYERQQNDRLPAAHLHVHAHRDETTWMMTLGQRNRPSLPGRADEMPILAALHFPLGGHRFRPCLEDVLEMIINEFGVDTRDTHWRSALRDGRMTWRTKQLSAAVRDSPQTAAEALREAGWTVHPPEGVTDGGIGRLGAL